MRDLDKQFLKAIFSFSNLMNLILSFISLRILRLQNKAGLRKAFEKLEPTSEALEYHNNNNNNKNNHTFMAICRRVEKKQSQEENLRDT